jgi:hypothetical protein
MNRQDAESAGLDNRAGLRYELSMPVIARFYGITVKWQTQEYELLPGLD